MPLLPTTVNQIICSMPRSGGNLLLDLLAEAGVKALGEWPQDLPEHARTALVHLHYVNQIEVVPERAIYLYRRNQLAQAVSWAVAMRTEEWKTGVVTGPVHLEVGEVASLAGELQAAERHWLDWLAARSVPTLLLAYEDLVTDRQVRGRAVKWFEGDPANLGAELPRQRQASWVNEVHVERARVDVERLLSDGENGLDDRLRRAKMSRGYVRADGSRRDA